MIAFIRALSQHRAGYDHTFLCLPIDCGLGFCYGCRGRALCLEVPCASGAAGKLPATSNAYTEGDHPQLSASAALSTQCHSDWQYKSGCPLGKDDMLVAGKVNAESALQRRSPACLKMPLSLFLYVTLSYLSCFGYGINCSCSPALHCILNILF